MNDLALRRPRKSALLWCRHEDIRPLRDERYKRCVLVVILYFALRNAREGLGKTALTASTAGLGGAGTAQGGGGMQSYRQLIDGIEAEMRSEKPRASAPADEPIETQRQGVLFDSNKMTPRQG